MGPAPLDGKTISFRDLFEHKNLLPNPNSDDNSDKKDYDLDLSTPTHFRTKKECSYVESVHFQTFLKPALNLCIILSTFCNGELHNGTESFSALQTAKLWFAPFFSIEKPILFV